MKKMAKLKQARKTSKNSLKLFTSIPPIYYSIFCYKNTERMSLCDLDPPFCKMTILKLALLYRELYCFEHLKRNYYESKTTYYDVLVG